MKASYVIGILLMFMLTFTCCSDDDNLLSNTTWAAKVMEGEIGVPEQYREKASWVLHFSKKEFTVTIGVDGYEVLNMYKGTYYFIDENEAKGECTNGMIMIFKLKDDGSYMYCEGLGHNFIKQKTR